MANIADFKAQMIGGGARPNQFRVELTFPSYVTLGTVAGQRAQFLCKAAQLPASTIENLPVLYRGRPVNFAGERSFQPWTVTVYNDTTFGIRNALEQWQSGIQNYNTTNGRTNPTDYQVDLQVHQLDRNGGIIKTYKFVDAYPTAISAIGLDYEHKTLSNNSILNLHTTSLLQILAQLLASVSMFLSTLQLAVSHYNFN
jgi:hypothetical protein